MKSANFINVGGTDFAAFFADETLPKYKGEIYALQVVEINNNGIAFKLVKIKGGPNVRCETVRFVR